MDQDSELTGIPTNVQRAEDVTLPSEAAERKRILNILAQRRYRRRRRERQVALENFVSQSVEKQISTPSLASQEQNDGSPASDSSFCNTASSSSAITSDSDTSFASSEMPYQYHKDYWVPLDSWEMNNDVSAFLTDTSWNSPEAVIELNNYLQTDDIQNATFADDFSIAVPELDLLRAAYENAGRLQSGHLLFAGMNAQSVFQSSDCSSWILDLPENLQPTATQLAIPHHPLIDILPWPAVRTRLIRMYNLPSNLWPRHPADGTESSVVRLVYDMEDGGVRVTGSDPAKESAWEVEQKFFETWWWALDQNVVSMSNVKRSARGQQVLCAPSANH